MELTENIMKKEKEIVETRILETYGKDSKEYRDMMFAVNLYYQFLLQILMYK